MQQGFHSQIGCRAVANWIQTWPGNGTRLATPKNNGGRGGIRTHGGFPHARFRVECLKPDSATLPRCRIVDGNSRRAIIWCNAKFAKAKHHASVNSRFRDLGAMELACTCEFDLTVLGGGCGTDSAASKPWQNKRCREGD